MTKKGIVEEIFSKAQFADDPKVYKIFYRDFERTVECTLLEFLIQSDNFQTIPTSRIIKIMKSNTVLFEKNDKRDE